MQTQKAPATHTTHTTFQEMEYLDGLGSWCGRPCDQKKRLKLLKRYLDTAYTRRWDSGVDVEACIAHANKLLGWA